MNKMNDYQINVLELWNISFVIPYNMVENYKIFLGTLPEYSVTSPTLATEVSDSLKSLVILHLTTWHHMLRNINFKLEE
jgi:hypothetical protein